MKIAKSKKDCKYNHLYLSRKNIKRMPLDLQYFNYTDNESIFEMFHNAGDIIKITYSFTGECEFFEVKKKLIW